MSPPPPVATLEARLRFWWNQQVRLGRRVASCVDAGTAPPVYLLDALSGVQSLVAVLRAEAGRA